jgi:macrolide-specific efflux system membrane fusion protein
MNKKRWWILLVSLIILGSGAYWVFHKKHRGRGEAMTTLQAAQGSIEDLIQATGNVVPLNRVAIQAPIAGRIEQLLVDEGNAVHGGQILAWMSSTDRAAILDAARAQGPDAYKHWEDSYKPTPIIAPLSGVIILKNVVVGQTVDTTVVIYAMSDHLIVIAQVDEADIGRIKLGMPARVTLDAYPDRIAEGKVFQILQEGVNVSNVITYNVKIDLGKAPDYYRSQMTANIVFVVRKQDNAVLVPSGAVRDSRSDPGQKVVMIPGPDGHPVPQDVETGIDNGDQVEITSGLKSGDSILVRTVSYTPQQGPQTSPLTMSGKPGQGGGGGGSHGNH